MATVSPARPARREPAPAPPVRSGTCRLLLQIGATDYTVRPMPAPPGFRVVWVLRKQDPQHSAAYSVVHQKGHGPDCSCPDRQINGAVCKHIRALAALGLIPALKGPRPRKARPAAAAPSGPPAPPAPARGPVAIGFSRAIDEHLAMRRMAERIDGTPRPEPEETPPEGFLCAYCGEPFDPAVSRDPHFCGPCAEEGGYK
jgi:SWIM zinc finger